VLDKARYRALWLLEQAVFSLQDKLQEASPLEGRPAAIAALLAVTEFCP
jgi:hypothetical protein